MLDTDTVISTMSEQLCSGLGLEVKPSGNPLYIEAKGGAHIVYLGYVE